MPDRFYSVVLGEQRVDQVTEGSSTSSEAIELRINDSVYANKLQVLHAIDALRRYVQNRETSPIA